MHISSYPDKQRDYPPLPRSTPPPFHTIDMLTLRFNRAGLCYNAKKKRDNAAKRSECVANQKHPIAFSKCNRSNMLSYVNANSYTDRASLLNANNRTEKRWQARKCLCRVFHCILTQEQII